MPGCMCAMQGGSLLERPSVDPFTSPRPPQPSVCSKSSEGIPFQKGLLTCLREVYTQPSASGMWAHRISLNPSPLDSSCHLHGDSHAEGRQPVPGCTPSVPLELWIPGALAHSTAPSVVRLYLPVCAQFSVPWASWCFQKLSLSLHLPLMM